MDIPAELIEAKRLTEPFLLALPGITGVGLGAREENGELFDELAVRVLVADAATAPELPREVGGVPVCVIERQYEPLGFPDEHRYAELRGGIKITVPTHASGTMGAIVQDISDREPLGLSCYHVVGDPDRFPNNVWQPHNPPLVVGSQLAKDDNVGDVVKVDFPQTSPLPFSPVVTGLTDSAVFRLDAGFGQGRTVSRAIAGDGPGLPDMVTAVTATATPTIFQPVRKRGYFTGPTTGQVFGGRVVGLWTTVKWSPGGRNAWLMEQVELWGGGGVFARPGDSGSLVLDAGRPTALGVLWGGTKGGEFAPSGKFGTMSLIGHVEDRLGVSTVWA